MAHLIILLLNWDETTTKAATALFLRDEIPEGKDLPLRGGVSIPEFFKTRGVPIADFMEMFPGNVEPMPKERQLDTKAEISWDSSLTWCMLPTDRDDMARLSKFLGLPICVFTYRWHGDGVPKLWYSVN